MAKKSNRNGKKAKMPISQTKAKPKARVVPRQKARTLSQPNNPTFGAVSTINTAPVAIGNSLRGSKAQVLHTTDGCAVIGRDFCFTAMNSGTVTAWCLVGGIPTAPYAYPSSVLRNVSTMYNRYKLRRAVFHYITSSPTSTAGDVMFYFRRQEGGNSPQPTSTAFLPYVLSDTLTVLGPQWTNHSAELVPTQNWLSTDYGATPDPQEYNHYDVFLYSKTTSNSDSPGYVVVDYHYEFRELSINPRAGNIASVGGISSQWLQVALSVTGAKTANTTIISAMTFGTTGIGGTAITAPTYVTGDVVELILDVSNSTFSTTTAATFLSYVAGVSAANANLYVGTTLTDGDVLYTVMGNSTHPDGLFNNCSQAFTNTSAAAAGATVTYAETLQCWARRIGTVNNQSLSWSQ